MKPVRLSQKPQKKNNNKNKKKKQQQGGSGTIVPVTSARSNLGAYSFASLQTPVGQAVNTVSFYGPGEGQLGVRNSSLAWKLNVSGDGTNLVPQLLDHDGYSLSSTYVAQFYSATDFTFYAYIPISPNWVDTSGTAQNVQPLGAWQGRMGLNFGEFRLKTLNISYRPDAPTSVGGLIKISYTPTLREFLPTTAGEAVDTANAFPIAYVTNPYTPISVNLTRALPKGNDGWRRNNRSVLAASYDEQAEALWYTQGYLVVSFSSIQAITGNYFSTGNGAIRTLGYLIIDSDVQYRYPALAYNGSLTSEKKEKGKLPSISTGTEKKTSSHEFIRAERDDADAFAPITSSSSAASASSLSATPAVTPTEDYYVLVKAKETPITSSTVDSSLSKPALQRDTTSALESLRRK